ncbi:response regulator [Pseudomonas seleniipraecipitans]|jgi:CheY-like chemotaxis protein|uniref:Response regulator n=1 Tax=Phytopseudomonas seleniipraecipitans TaxID=640205 RepID=A0A1G7SGY9_9GAMM|nr:response regulator [Pseudomonas seleniipraecipitans]UUD65772.1 response regulator [Pseudomonas seleniipraecipitans]SDG22335.1 Response regulator receiver domain-containing protein [Pseudomonas seleniipraecipitans]
MLKPILLVEDNPHDLELTLIALERSQLANDVIVMRDGAEALDYLFRRGEHADRLPGNPAIMMLDLKLPKVDGLQVLKIVRDTPELRSIPIVMLTSSREGPDLQRAYELNVNAYVVKPVEFKAFVSAISDLGVFWAVLNEPPPGSLRLHRRGSENEPEADNTGN